MAPHFAARGKVSATAIRGSTRIEGSNREKHKHARKTRHRVLHRDDWEHRLCVYLIAGVLFSRQEAQAVCVFDCWSFDC